MNINSTQSLRDSIRQAIHTIEDLVAADTAEVENNIETEVSELKADVSPVIHKITITPLQVGHDIQVQLSHAAGEVRRVVISGQTTLDSLVTKLTSLVS